MADSPNPAAVDQAVSQIAAADMTQVPASELVNLRERSKMVDTLQREAQANKVDAAISTMLAGETFVNEAARLHARELLASRVDRASGRPVEDVIKEALASGEFAHFLAARSKGGGPYNAPIGTPPGGNVARVGFVDQVAANLKHQREQFKGRGLPTRR